MSSHDKTSRRRFLGAAAVATGISIVPRHVLGGHGTQFRRFEGRGGTAGRGYATLGLPASPVMARVRGRPGMQRVSASGGRDVVRPIARSVVAIARQALHAYRIELSHPKTGQPVVFEAPLPEDFDRTLTALRAT